MDVDDKDKVIAELRAALEAAQQRIAELVARNQQLEGRLAELERVQARQAAPFRREEKRKVPPEKQKRPGRKPGHPGAHRQIPQDIDEEIEVPLSTCPDCRCPLEDRAPLVQYIEEVPELRPRVTRLVTWQGHCPCCDKTVASSHPLKTSNAQGAAAVQVGPRAQAIAALLNKGCGLSMGNTVRVMQKLLGLSLTRGGLSQALDRVADRLQSEYDRLQQQIRASAAVFADETSWWVNEAGWWLWVFTTPETTLYHVDHCRAASVAKEILGEDFAGMLVSDCLGSYDPLACKKHKCIAHHLRAITKARERPDTKDPSYLASCRITVQLIGILYRLRPKMPDEEFVNRRAALEESLDRVLSRSVSQPGDVAVQNRLLKQRPHLTGCLYEPAAEPTNNRAERALRPAVIARKISCGNRTLRGKRTWQILASLSATYAQRSIDFIDRLAQTLPLVPQAG